jgi:hypothetical protein
MSSITRTAWPEAADARRDAITLITIYGLTAVRTAIDAVLAWVLSDVEPYGLHLRVRDSSLSCSRLLHLWLD